MAAPRLTTFVYAVSFQLAGSKLGGQIPVCSKLRVPRTPPPFLKVPGHEDRRPWFRVPGHEDRLPLFRVPGHEDRSPIFRDPGRKERYHLFNAPGREGRSPFCLRGNAFSDSYLAEIRRPRSIFFRAQAAFGSLRSHAN